jgi:hypothetical protein
VGALLVFVVRGGLWSDVPGWTLLVSGVFLEMLFTLAYVVARLSR